MEELALAYVARFATTAAKLQAYLLRKLRERGFDAVSGADTEAAGDDGAGRAAADALVARFVAAGYVDDAGFARTRSEGLLRRGYGPRRVEQALRAAGVDEEVRTDVAAGDKAARTAALAMARRRGFGPFALGGRGIQSPETRQKHLAAMVRAGHSFAHAQAVLDAPDEAVAHDWVAEGAGDEDDEI